MASQVRFPEIRPQAIYRGKSKDWSPDIRAAGKLTTTGDTAEMCLKPKNERPPSPEVIRKFRATVRPDAGQMRIFYGKAYDPQLKRAASMTHGISTQPSFTSGDLVNPRPKSLFEQRCLDRKENLYASHLRAPLGVSHDQRPGFPSGLNPHEFTFGLPTELDIGAGGLVNPNKTYDEVEKESVVGHELYRQTHSDYDPGEQFHRSYTSPSFMPTRNFGVPTPHNNDGIQTKKTLKWLHETQQEKASKVVSKRVDDFRERTQPQLGQVHDPIKDTLNVPSDHTFGILLKPDEYGAGDLMHMRAPGDYLRGKDRQRGVLAAIRQHLKKSNYHNFPDLMAAFRHYDKEGTGKISIIDLREACVQFHLPVEPELLEQLMDYCDFNKDGFIDYLEFSNFLNWKDKMESGFPPKQADTLVVSPQQEGSRHSARSSTGSLVKGDDLVPKSPQSGESTPRRLQKQIDRAIGSHRTSAQMINAVVGTGGFSTRGFRTYGVPTIRTDLPGPRIKRVCDRTNYGDESDAYGLVNPSLFSHHGVFEKDFLIPRTREELKDIFSSTGILMTGETFEQLYNTAAQKHPRGHVSVEALRNVLDEVQGEQIATGKHPVLA